MNGIIHRGWIVGCLLFVVAWLARPSLDQNEELRYFPETGHWVSGDFLEKYLSATNPQAIYGAPITEAFEDRLSGQTIQYFQKARFGLDPHQLPPLRIELAHLGEMLYQPGAASVAIPNSSACRTYLDREFKVCFAFLDYFETNGRVAQFGYPISNFEFQEGLIVQYYQRARFEWHPELPPGQHILLTDLGSRYFSYVGENPDLLRPILGNNIPQTIVNLKVLAFPRKTVIPIGGNQTLYIIVRDQNLRPVPEAQVIIFARYPSGREETFTAASTDGEGVTSYGFPVIERQFGMVEISVSVTYETFQGKTFTSFYVWW